MQPTLNALQQADDLAQADLDSLPFGLIQLDLEGVVIKYNAYEARLARMQPEEVVGRNFFHDVAPCTRIREFHGRFVDGVQRRDLHEVFPFRFAFQDGRQKDVVITLFYSSRSESVWVSVQRPAPPGS